MYATCSSITINITRFLSVYLGVSVRGGNINGLEFALNPDIHVHS